MSRTWFTSDLHFSHKLVAQLRGFVRLAGPHDHVDDGTVEGCPGCFGEVGDTEAHDATIIENWNRVVKPEDVVWVLGDVGMGHLPRFADQLDQLWGRKHLITGNHDDPWPGNRDSFKYQRSWLERFESVQPFARKKIDGITVLLSHFPYEGDHTDEERCLQYRLRDYGEWLLHGHTHWKHRQWHDGRQIHIGLDAWELAPVPMECIQEIIHIAASPGKEGESGNE